MTSMSRGATYVAECAEVQVLNHAFLQINHRLLRGRCNHWPTQQWLPDWCYLCPSRIWSTPRLWPQSGGHLCVLRSFVAPRVKIPHPPRHSRRGCRRPLSHCRNSCCAGYAVWQASEGWKSQSRRESWKMVSRATAWNRINIYSCVNELDFGSVHVNKYLARDPEPWSNNYRFRRCHVLRIR